MPDDRPFERLLRGAARRGRQAGPCPDAALLAAYADGALSHGERATVERHAADCPRCTEHLALLASLATVPAVEAPQAGRTPLTWRGWKRLVLAATVVVVFAVWQRIEMTPEPEQPPQRFAARSESTPAPAGDDSTKSETSAGTSSGRQSPGPAAPEVSTNRAPAVSQEKADARARQQSGRAAAPAPVLDKTQEEQRRASKSASSPVAAGAGGGVARPHQAESQIASFGTPQDPVRVVTAAPGVLVRLSRAGIERSTDAGEHWTTELANAVAPPRVVACASAEVCWAGGNRGLLLRRDASGAWTRRPLPATSAAVAGIDAASADEAVVTLSDGRRFRTADGGATWTSLRR